MTEGLFCSNQTPCSSILGASQNDSNMYFFNASVVLLFFPILSHPLPGIFLITQKFNIPSLSFYITLTQRCAHHPGRQAEIKSASAEQQMYRAVLQRCCWMLQIHPAAQGGSVCSDTGGTRSLQCRERWSTNILSRFSYLFLPFGFFHLSNTHCINTMTLLGSSRERMWQGPRFLITL